MEEILHHLGCMKPYKQWDKLPINWLAGFQPSTVSLGKPPTVSTVRPTFAGRFRVAALVAHKTATKAPLADTEEEEILRGPTC